MAKTRAIPTLAQSKYFPANLAWMMQQRGLSNLRLSRYLGISRQAVHNWLLGQTRPTEENFAALCVALRCESAELLAKRRAGPAMLTISEWARREGIPIGRARDLFALRLLQGEQNTGFTILVPKRLRAPRDSKRLVLMAKRRPRWVETFHTNFPRLLTAAAVTHSEVASKTKVKSAAVLHWAQQRNYPERQRLPLIAKVLGVSLQELAGHV